MTSCLNSEGPEQHVNRSVCNDLGVRCCLAGCCQVQIIGDFGNKDF